jgi:putative transposase
VLVRAESSISVRRLAQVFVIPVATVGRWVGRNNPEAKPPSQRLCPVSGDSVLREAIRSLCQKDRHQTYGHRRIRALLLRHHGLTVNHKTVYRIMRDLSLLQPRVWRRPQRAKRVERMRPSKPNQGWQIDMTCFELSDLRRVYLTVVIDCFSRQLVGWTLDQRCRASEWISALRQGLESRQLSAESCRSLVLRSDNGAQPCSQKFVAFLSQQGIKGEYTGYDAPDDNAYVERVIRTIKEEEVWLNSYDSFQEAHQAIENYINFYNQERIHQALDYKTPNETAAPFSNLNAA